LVDTRKIFNLKELRVLDPHYSAQNIQNKQLKGKFLKSKDLGIILAI